MSWVIVGNQSQTPNQDKCHPKIPQAQIYCSSSKKEDRGRQEKLGILEKIQTAQWAAPIVAVPKPSEPIPRGIYEYPLPRPEELFAALNGREKFTKLDLSEAYFQIELEDESKQYLVINTYRGLYQFNRLPYGVASAPAIFKSCQKYLGKPLKVMRSSTK